MTSKQQEYLTKFGLSDGQFFGDYRYKNLWWYVNDLRIGYGDLTVSQIARINLQLAEGEEFFGWNEHHGTHFQQTDLPMIHITKDKIKHRWEIVNELGGN